jgi:hypothetical protein
VDELGSVYITRTRFCSVNFKARDHLEDIGIKRRAVSNWIIKKQVGRAWTESILPSKNSRLVNIVMNLP